MRKLALMGAAGKIGFRIAANLAKLNRFDPMFVENSPAGAERLRAAGMATTPMEEALPLADVVVMAVPDRLIPTVCEQMKPHLKKGGMVMMLDPAAAYAGRLPMRGDVAYFITHPCHPPFINDETDPEAKKDYFGGALAKQNIVCALLQGGEEDYAVGEAAAKAIFSPVMNAYRVTVEQMAILEPGLVETVLATVLTGLRQAMDRVVAMGVPAEAAKAFLMGHMQGEAVVVFDYVDYKMSDACMKAVELAMPKIFRDGWLDEVFDIAAIRKSVADIIQ